MPRIIKCTILLFLLLLTPVSGSAIAQEETPEPALSLEVLGTYETGLRGQAASEIVAFDPGTQRAFIANAANATVDIVDMSDPAAATLIDTIDITPYGASANSVAVSAGVLAIAVEAEVGQENGSVVFFDMDGTFISSVEAGSWPDMLTFTPDGAKVVVANEGQPSDDYTVDPEGSVTIIDVTGGVENLTQENVVQVSFTKFNDVELDPSIRIYGPNASVAQDLEPEYVAVSGDSATAYVTLQENNAIAVIDLNTGEATTLLGLGFKDHNRPVATLETAEFTGLPVLGTTAAGQEILLGGFSGLYFEGVDEETGLLEFITHPDRGPNAEPVDVNGDGVVERPFPLPDFQSQWVRFTYDSATSALTITERISLTHADGTPISGLPNLVGDAGMAYADEEPIDLFGNPLAYDPYGADMEGIVRAEDGSYWMVDEYRPAIYHFTADGILIDRFVPQGSNAAVEGVEVGTEALPEVLAARRANRGFEAVALHEGILYAFVQSPLDNPDTPNDANSAASLFTRIIAFDTATNSTVGQYLYPIDGRTPGTNVDKIGDAVALPTGEILVIERDADVGPTANKFIYRISLGGATNLQELESIDTGLDSALDRQNALGLAQAGIVPVQKTLVVDLAEIGYHQGDKPEGLALIDENTLAVLNDNDFRLIGTFDPATGLLDDNPNAVSPILGIIHLPSNGLDASDEDGGINIQPWPVLGMYLPDAIAAYEVNGETYLVTANEGDARDYDGYSEEARVKDLVLDWAVFPNAQMLQRDENLGRLKTTTAQGDTNGDGLVDVIYSYGARSFTIWHSGGQRVFDSGDEMARITAEAYPDGFNASGELDSFDSRSDDKGTEPEAIELGVINGRTYAFIGLERIGGIMVYDVTDPMAPAFIQYINNRDFAVSHEESGSLDLAPEGIQFVPAEESPTGGPLLLVANEFSGTLTAYAIQEGVGQ